MGKRITLVILALILGGCITPAVTTWSLNGNSLAQFRRDAYACSRDARMSTYDGPNSLSGMLDAQSNANSLYNQCMESKGYTPANHYSNNHQTPPPAPAPAPQTSNADDEAAKSMMKSCMAKDTDPDLRIKSCTGAIMSGKLSNAGLSAAYLRRSEGFHARHEYDLELSDYDQAISYDPKSALAFFDRATTLLFFKREYDKAIADYSVVIDLKPQYAPAYSMRGLAWSNMGNQKQAIADLDTAIHINPLDPDLFFVRGRAYFLSGNYALAEVDLARGYDLKPDPYTALWLYLAKTHTSKNAGTVLMKDFDALPSQDWPRPIALFYTGKLSADELSKAASSAPPDKLVGRRCDEGFYVAEWQLLHHRKQAARTDFEKAEAVCPMGTYESLSAAIEIAR